MTNQVLLKLLCNCGCIEMQVSTAEVESTCWPLTTRQSDDSADPLNGKNYTILKEYLQNQLIWYQIKFLIYKIGSTSRQYDVVLISLTWQLHCNVEMNLKKMCLISIWWRKNTFCRVEKGAWLRSFLGKYPKLRHCICYQLCNRLSFIRKKQETSRLFDDAYERNISQPQPASFTGELLLVTIYNILTNSHYKSAQQVRSWYPTVYPTVSSSITYYVTWLFPNVNLGKAC